MQPRGHFIGRRQTPRQGPLHTLAPGFELRAESLSGNPVVRVHRAPIG
jgi:hypothetical protein